MLDSVTKKRIDDLRNILVGKIPSPQSQVEQITTGLIYKFMYDMDNEAIEMGGVPSFFVDKYEKYSWKHLFNAKLGGVEKVKLYSDAIENLYTNPNAPSIFREIFKNSFLPFKDPSTLNMFLKEINEFDYSNSENLGDAYEYLLSFMGSQGDAGQFRTPRHIIDFIIEVVNPKKNETILDPACGSAGFLISSYKHILNQNTHKRIGDQLNASERKKVGSNLFGYDIDPAMSRISVVNMYLHNFASPNISEYDTLSSEEKWNEYFDVILANPPFFSPTGGIKPHSRFGVKSTRAEVLFVDYIIEHLKPKGRAGIIVPEGIIFEKKNAYKTLRKKLVENALAGVISLPAGVFQPYSGVKTSILILDKELNQKSKSIFFAKVENDGFSLGSQRKKIENNDIPTIVKEINEFFFSSDSLKDNEKVWSVKKSEIENEPSYLLSPERYKTISKSSSKFEITSLENVCISIDDGDWIESKDQSDKGIRLIQTGNIGIGKYLDKPEKSRFISKKTFQELNCRALKTTNILVSRLPDPVGRACKPPTLIDQSITSVDVSILEFDISKIIPDYFIFLTQSVGYKNEINRYLTGASRQRISKENLKKIEIPLPPIQFQEEILDELISYQKVIDGCRQVIDNYQPTFEIDTSWEMITLGQLLEISRGGSPRPIKKFITEGDGINWIKIGDATSSSKYIYETKEKITYEGSKKSRIVQPGDFILSNSMSFGRPYIMKTTGCIHDGWLLLKYDSNHIKEDFLYYILSSKFVYDQFKRLATGGVVNNLNKDLVSSVLVPKTNLEEQEKLITVLEEEREIIQSNIKLIKIYTQRIQNKINKIWEA